MFLDVFNITINKGSLIRTFLVFLIFFIFYIQKSCELNKERKINRKELEQLKKQKDSIINSHFQLIKQYDVELKEKTIAIENAKSKLDSLTIIKNKVTIVYKEKIKEVNNFNGESLEKYWENEFK
jgi:hypothetical protein